LRIVYFTNPKLLDIIMQPMGKVGGSYYAIDVLYDPLDGTSGAQACSVHAVAKRNSLGAPHLVANEFICGRLAMLMGLPVPPGAMAKLDDGGLAYVSLRFGPRGERPPPVAPAELVADHPELALRIVAFDCWVANTDRHEGNLIYLKAPGSRPMIFDHDKALMAGLGKERLERVRDEAILDGCLVEHLRASKGGRAKAAEHCRWIADNLLEGVCDEAFGAGAVSEDDRDAVVDFLRVRATSLLTMLNQLPGQLELG